MLMLQKYNNPQKKYIYIYIFENPSPDFTPLFWFGPTCNIWSGNLNTCVKSWNAIKQADEHEKLPSFRCPRPKIDIHCEMTRESAPSPADKWWRIVWRKHNRFHDCHELLSFSILKSWHGNMILKSRFNETGTGRAHKNQQIIDDHYNCIDLKKNSDRKGFGGASIFKYYLFKYCFC